jgi:hypothetical protein
MLTEVGQPDIKVGFLKFLRNVETGYIIKYECEIKKKYIIIFILCIRKIYSRYFLPELIDYIFGHFLKCTHSGTNMLTI